MAMFNSYVSLPEGIEISSQIIKSMVKPFTRTRDWMDCSSILGGRIESKRQGNIIICQFLGYTMVYGCIRYNGYNWYWAKTWQNQYFIFILLALCGLWCVSRVRPTVWETQNPTESCWMFAQVNGWVRHSPIRLARDSADCWLPLADETQDLLRLLRLLYVIICISSEIVGSVATQDLYYTY